MKERLGRWTSAARGIPKRVAGIVRDQAARSRGVAATAVETAAFAAGVRGAWVVHAAAGWVALAAVLYFYSLVIDTGAGSAEP